jgi:hypothetical protein
VSHWQGTDAHFDNSLKPTLKTDTTKLDLRPAMDVIIRKIPTGWIADERLKELKWLA